MALDPRCRLLKCRVNIFVSRWPVRDETIAVCSPLAACRVGGTTESEQCPEKPKYNRIGENEVMDALEVCGGRQESLTGRRSQASVGNLLETQQTWQYEWEVLGYTGAEHEAWLESRVAKR